MLWGMAHDMSNELFEWFTQNYNLLSKKDAVFWRRLAVTGCFCKAAEL